MHDAVEGHVVAEVLAHLVGEAVEVLLVGHVELDDRGRLRQALGDALDQGEAPEAGQDDLGALVLGDLRRLEGDRGLGEDTRDEDALAGENSTHGDQ
ncbi:hypothetical protein GCM10020000_62790 [Streptomyces olivoverticillatus]